MSPEYTYETLLKLSTPWTISFAIIGFILGFIACNIFLKKKLLVRHIPLWNAASKLLYLLTIFGTTAIMALYGFVYGTQRTASKQIETELLGISTVYSPMLIGYLGDRMRSYGPEKMVTVREIIDASIDDILYRPQSDSALERLKAKIINHYILTTAADAFGEAFQKILLQKVELLGSALKEKDFKGQENGELAKFSVDLVMKITSDGMREVDFSAIDRNVPQLIVDAVMKMINRLFLSLYLYITLMLVVLIGLISGEIYIYRHYYMMDATIIDEVKPTAAVVITQKRISTTRDGLKVFFGSWLVLIIVTILIVLFSSTNDTESAIGWWLVGVAAILSVVICPLVLVSYIFYRRKYKSNSRPLQILSVLACSLITFRMLGVSYLQGIRGNITIAVVAVIFIWFVLFLICLTVSHFITRNKKLPLDNTP